jgi:hypothetical protein
MSNVHEKQHVQLPEQTAALAYNHAPLPSSVWYEEIINALDEPISVLLAADAFAPVALDKMLQNWSEENGEVAKQILWAFDTQYQHVFGFLIADLVEDEEVEKVAMFYDALERERIRS